VPPRQERESPSDPRYRNLTPCDRPAATVTTAVVTPLFSTPTSSNGIGAEVDCEHIGQTWLGQPVNSLTTLGFVVCGLVIATRRPERVWVGVAVVATGFGSFLFHGPMPAGSQWVHDVTLAWLLVVVPGVGTRWDGWVKLPGLILLGAVFALASGLADPFTVSLTAISVVVLLKRDRSLATYGPLTLLVLSAGLGRLGATGWPLCDPDSLLQPHGIWHLASAAAVMWWALSAPGPTRPVV
jgi:hypothetical protein